jgi:hypothetical protein
MVVAALLAAAIGCTNDNPARLTASTKSEREQTRQPPEILDLDGNLFDLWEGNARRLATVIVFTRSDCPISNRFAPEISRVYAAYRPRGVEFFLVYVDPREQSDAIRHHMKEYGYTCVALRDPEHELVAYCQATITPEAVVFDKNRAITYQGRVTDLYAALGKSRTESTTHDLAEAIESTIAGQPVATPRTKAIGCPIAELK